MKQRNVKARKATHFRSEAESLRVDKNRSRCGHMSTVTGKDSLGDPVSDEESVRVGQLDYFEQVLMSSMAASGERLEQLRRVGCRAMRRMPTVTGSTAAVKGWVEHSDHLSEVPCLKGVQQVSWRGLRRTQRLRET